MKNSNMYEVISELLILLIMLFLWLSSPGIEGIKNLLFVGIVYLGVVIRHKGEEE